MRALQVAALSFTALLPAARGLSQDAASDTPFRLLKLSGTPYERGFQHGEALRDEIGATFTAWKQDLASRISGDAGEWLAQFLANTEFDTAVRRHCPDLLDEVRGIAAGSGQSFADVFAWQLIDEQWVAFLDGEHCTTFGVDATATSPAFVAQNLDVPPWMHAVPVVLRIEHCDSDLRSYVVTMPGLIGANGLNNHRVAIGVNTILQIAPSRDGLPVAFVVRGVLQQQDHAAALDFVRRVRHASGQAYTIGGPRTAPCFECSAEAGAVRSEPFPGRGLTVHTNHPLESRDFAARFRRIVAEQGHDLDDLPWNCPRLEHALDVLGSEASTAASANSLDTVLGLLRSRVGEVSICNGHTYACTVMVLGERPELRVGFGAPDRTPLTTLRFD